jgi:hypothetical protein
MDFQLSGKLYEIYPTQQKTEKFKAREFVLETSKQVGEREITDYVKFQATGDKCDVLNRYKTGDTVTIHFNIRGNRWEKDGKVSYFTNLDAWRIDGVTNDKSTPYESLDKLQREASNQIEDDPFNSGLPF